MPRRTNEPFLKGKLRLVEVPVRIKYRPPARFDQLLVNALQLLSEPLVLEQLMRQAIAETLLLAYRRRFAKGLPGAVTMQLDRRRLRDRATPTVKAQIRTAYITALTAVQQLSPTARPDVRAKAEERLRVARRAFEGSLARRARLPKERRLAHTGRFRSLALDLVGMITDESAVTFLPSNGSLRAGIGPTSALDQYKTPSATPGGAGPGARDILWKQLEFGTGVYSRLKSAQRDTYRLPSGGWWYGRSPNDALHLKGTRGVHALYDPDTLMRYDEDYVRFTRVFHTYFVRALFSNLR